MTSYACELSIVIPVYNEAESVPQLYARLVAALTASQPMAPFGGPVAASDEVATAARTWELIIVDDGSQDGTWEALQGLAARDAHVRAIRLKRNFGQTAAMSCGIEAARGRVIVTMDGDLQNDPADIPRLLAKLEEGYDVVCGWRVQRQDRLWSRKVPSMVANRLIGWLTGVRLHDYGCSLKAYRAQVIKRTPLYAEFHRFITALVTLTGALVTEVKVQHHARQYGRTKYNLWRTWKVAFDMVTVAILIKFASKPLRFFGLLALCCAAVAAVCFARSWEWYLGPYRHVPQVLPGVALLGVWLAGHLFIVGLIAELCLATSHAKPERLISAQEG